MDAKTTLAASVQAKKGRLYAVIQVKENGKTNPCDVPSVFPKTQTNQR